MPARALIAGDAQHFLEAGLACLHPAYSVLAQALHPVRARVRQQLGLGGAIVDQATRLIVDQVAKMGASGIITQGFVGEDSVRAAVEAAGAAEVFVITEMSHPGGATFTALHAEEMATIAMRAGAAGIVAPATRPVRVKVLRSIVGSKLILAPGVGSQGGKASDAIAAGADAVIVGRSIYEAKDPGKAAREIAEEIRARA